jgi:hypothetical protein
MTDPGDATLNLNLQTQRTRKIMVNQNAVEYTRRWWPDQKRSSRRSPTTVQWSVICGPAKARR